MDPSSLAEAIRRTIFAIDPGQPVSNVRTLEQIVASSVVDRRMMLVVLGLFAATALILAAMGLYGVIAYAVTQRRPEIGVRMALGATPVGILAMVVREGIQLTAIGVITGLLGAFALTRVLAHVLFRVTPTDPVTLFGVTLLLVAVALFACYLPARRASEIDPMAALRCD
jgi:ABC-type antimicrobial peptide transport system permease subunit